MDLKEAIERLRQDEDEMNGLCEEIIKSRNEAIETVLSELEKKEAVIKLMAKKLVEAHDWFYSEFDNFTEKDWIEYFTKKVADINVGDIPEQN